MLKQLWGLAIAFTLSCGCLAQATETAGQGHLDWATWDDAFGSSGSRSFGIADDGSVRHAASRYRPESADAKAVEGRGEGDAIQQMQGEWPLTYDLSNNRIIASLSERGQVLKAGIVSGLRPMGGGNNSLRGVFVQKDLGDGGPWGFALAAGNAEATAFHRFPRVASDYLDGLFPLFGARDGDLQLRLLVFAPVEEPLSRAPRGIIQVLRIENRGSSAQSGRIEIVGAAGDGDTLTLAARKFVRIASNRVTR